MKIFMIGGTGLLGSEAAKERIVRGHEVSSLALPPLPTGAVLPPEMQLEFGNYLEMSDEELKKAYAEKPFSAWSLSHFPNYYCDLCRLYCPLGNWKERFGDTGLSGFGKEGGK